MYTNRNINQNTTQYPIPKPRLNNLGYVKNDSESRIQQGLMPQLISSSCFTSFPIGKQYLDICKNCSSCINTRSPIENIFEQPYELAQKSTQYKLIPPQVNENIMYPIHNDPVEYGMCPIPDNAPCTLFVQAP